MSDRRHQLGELLRASDGDSGCTAGQEIMDAYVERELAGEDPGRAFPGTATHLQSCPGCKNDHAGLLEAARRWLTNPERFAAAAAASGEPAPLLAEELSRRDQPSVRQRPQQQDAQTQRTSRVEGSAAPIRRFLRRLARRSPH
jgi:anti-sigma factor RsiW